MEILGLPLHPLVVHAAIILVPLAALGALLVVAVPQLRARYGWLTALFAAAAAGSAFVARYSGPPFATHLGLDHSTRIMRHATYGTWMPWPTLVLVIALVVFLWSVQASRGGTALRLVSGAVTALAALISLLLIGLTGHAGATAVWGP